jgi:hypothetical protein
MNGLHVFFWDVLCSRMDSALKQILSLLLLEVFLLNALQVNAVRMRGCFQLMGEHLRSEAQGLFKHHVGERDLRSIL